MIYIDMKKGGHQWTPLFPKLRVPDNNAVAYKCIHCLLTGVSTGNDSIKLDGRSTPLKEALKCPKAPPSAKLVRRKKPVMKRTKK